MLGRRTWVDHADAVLLEDPIAVEETSDSRAITAMLERAEDHARLGRWVVLTLAYEAAEAFGLACHSPLRSEPLAWMAAYEPGSVRFPEPHELRPPSALAEPPILELDARPGGYAERVEAIRAWIALGHTYQANLTVRAWLAHRSEALPWFLGLCEAHPVPYAAFIARRGSEVVSLSPELFLRRRGGVLESRPMKGTCRRGRDTREDAAAARVLLASAKERAENLMIVDMVRNDLGRIAIPGGVSVPELFTLERYRSVWQMTSLVRARLRDGVGLRGMLEATFPGASVTGAPKLRTMELIRDYETSPRGLYCGAIGLLRPGGDSTWSLPIRTLVHDGERWRLGLGSGITWGSAPAAEYDEVLAKSRFALQTGPPPGLFESMRRRPDGSIADLAEHLARLADSAEYWGYPFDGARAERAVRGADARGAAVLRLGLAASGDLSLLVRPAPPEAERPVRVLLVRERVDSRSPLPRHKTEQRELYQSARERALAAGFTEALLRNEAGRVTEGAITNVFVETEGEWRTPPVEEGLLPGIWRQGFAREVTAREAPLRVEDLAAASRVVVGNSVRGAIEVDEVWQEQTGEPTLVWRRT